MHLNQFFTPVLLAAGILAFGNVLATTHAAAPPPAAAGAPATAIHHAGFAKSVQGAVMVRSADGHERALQSGDRILPNDRVTTPKDGAASLVLRDGTTLVLGASSQADLSRFDFDSTSHEGNLIVSLVRGSLRMITGLISKARPDAMRVDTPTATIGIRGTDFIVSADE